MMSIARTCLWLASVALGQAAPESGAKLGLQLRDGVAVVEVEGLDPADLRRLAEAGRWEEFLPVSVAGQGADRPPMLGEYRIADGVLRFTPRFALVPGLRYRAVFKPGPISGREGTAHGQDVEAEFETAESEPAVPTAVRQVYPSGSTLPENLLKFYLHFTAPMSRGDVYDFIHLLDADGREIDGAFLKVDEELWDRDGVRLTLLIDPGRIKRDVGPREGFGPVLEAGRSYTLLIDAHWPDAKGRTLEGPYRKPFRTTDADATSPDLSSWQIRPPAAETVAPLLVDAPEPLDHALFQRLVRIQGPDGRDVAGRATVTEGEARWSFIPDAPWRPGGYRLAVGAELEDRAGNNLRGPFELDVFDSVGPRDAGRTLDRPFEVRSAP